MKGCAALMPLESMTYVQMFVFALVCMIYTTLHSHNLGARQGSGMEKDALHFRGNDRTGASAWRNCSKGSAVARSLKWIFKRSDKMVWRICLDM